MELNGYHQYKEQSILTMTQGELLILLYDELVKRLHRCDLALEQKDYALLDASVDRSVAIVRYLDDTLDQQYPISRDLHRLYDFFYYELSRVKAGRNRDALNQIRPMVTDLRDSFRAADKKCSETG